MARYRYDPKHPDASERGFVKITEDYVPADEARFRVVTDRHYEGIRATDGTDISSRKKRRDWMRRNNLADADDFKGVWAKAEKERQEFLKGQKKDPAMRDVIGRSIYDVRRGHRPTRAGEGEEGWH